MGSTNGGVMWANLSYIALCYIADFSSNKCHVADFSLSKSHVADFSINMCYVADCSGKHFLLKMKCQLTP